MYGVYDMKYYEVCVAIFNTCGEVAKYFNTSKNTIFSAITKGNLRERRYLIKKVEE